jgi:hypothetical protein
MYETPKLVSVILPSFADYKTMSLNISMENLLPKTKGVTLLY